MKWFWFLCLTAAAIGDVKDRSVSCRLLAVCGLVGILCGWGNGIRGQLAGVCAGAVMLAVSRVTGGAIGAGDGWFVIASAGYLRETEVWGLLLGSFGVSWIWAMGLVLWRAGKGKDARMDTLPFLACMWPVGLYLMVS